MTAPCAEIIERDDPHLYGTALFAVGKARSRLMVLYAFDCELSRATRSSTESLIPRMRLQWWRDVIADAVAGGAPKAHEVAGPLAQVIQSDPALMSDIQELDGADVLNGMINGHEMELDRPMDMATFEKWAALRFGTRLGLAGSISPLGPEFGHDADNSVACKVLALGLACRSAVRMARASGTCLLPDLAPGDHARLAEGKMEDAVAAAIAGHARRLVTELKTLRRSRRLKGEALVAHLPIRREARLLSRVARNPHVLLMPEVDDVPAFAGLRLAFAAWRNRW